MPCLGLFPARSAHASFGNFQRGRNPTGDEHFPSLLQHSQPGFEQTNPIRHFQIRSNIGYIIYRKFGLISNPVHSEIFVRICGLPLHEDINALRQLHLEQLIKTSGVVSATTGVLPQMRMVKFTCLKCAEILGPFAQGKNYIL